MFLVLIDVAVEGKQKTRFTAQREFVSVNR